MPRKKRSEAAVENPFPSTDAPPARPRVRPKGAPTALITQAGGEFFAPKTARSDPKEKPRPRPKDHPVDKIDSSIYNMRLTIGMHDDLRRLKNATGITVQAHVRRAILDYVHEMRTKHPEYWR